jgi:ABC-type bacteriocin/lantibiotic exporter with double-glycine peptidase domain
MDMALDVPHYRQDRNDYACGPVCIGMAIDYLRKRRNKKPLDFQECLGIAAKTMNGNLRRPSGTSKSVMKQTIRWFGYKVKELRGGETARLLQIRQAIKNHHPVILSCRADLGGDRYTHFIIVTGIDQEYVYFNDPYPGKRNKVSLEEFLGRGESLCWGSAQWGIEVF